MKKVNWSVIGLALKVSIVYAFVLTYAYMLYLALASMLYNEPPFWLYHFIVFLIITAFVREDLVRLFKTPLLKEVSQENE